MIIELFKTKKKEGTFTPYFTDNFIDIHSHILPGIDDGAKTIEHSLELLSKMKKLGIKRFICTPHVIEDVWENSTEKILNTFENLKSAVQNTPELSDVQLKVAAEYMMDNNFHALLKKSDLLPIKDNKILVEMSYLAPPTNLFEIIAEIQVKGFVPILAHPERYKKFHGELTVYSRLKEAGCLFQVNMISLTNYYGKSVHESAVWLLKNNMIDFVGSDIHHKRHLEQIRSLMSRGEMMDLISTPIRNNQQLI